MFANYTIPSILAQLSGIKDVDLEYWFFVDEKDLEYLQRFPQWSDFCSMFRKKIFPSNRDMHENYKNSIAHARVAKAILRLQPPDVINTENTLKFALGKIGDGFSGVVIPTGALRVNSDMPRLTDFSEANVVRAWLENMHLETSQHFIHSPFFFEKPVMKLERKVDEILVNSYYAQPILIDCRHRDFEYTDLELELFNSMDNVYVAKDSSEVFEISLSSKVEHEPPSNTYNEGLLRTRAGELNVKPFNETIYDEGYRIRTER